jgi:hypothetical protein
MPPRLTGLSVAIVFAFGFGSAIGLSHCQPPGCEQRAGTNGERHYESPEGHLVSKRPPREGPGPDDERHTPEP